MVTLLPVTLQLYPDEYLELAHFCQAFAGHVLTYEHQPQLISNGQLLLADFYARQFSYARQQTWLKRRRDKRYAFRCSLLYARLLHRTMQQQSLTEPQQRVLAGLDQLLV